MRDLRFPWFLLLGVAMAGPIDSLATGDDFFPPAYRAGSPAAAPQPSEAPAPPPMPDRAAKSAGTPTAPGRPRLTWSKPARGEKSPVEPIAPPLNSPLGGPTVAEALSSGATGRPAAISRNEAPTVAATLSVVADSPASVPQASRGMSGWFKKPGPEVPPGRPRGAERVAMAPPEPLAPTRLAVATESGPGRTQRTHPIPPLIARPAEPEADAPLRRVQATPNDLDSSASAIPGGAGAAATSPAALLAEATPSGRSLSLQQALTGAITSNPDLVALRAGSGATASLEAVEVARHFPTTLNPTVFIDYRPITLIPNGTFGNNGTGSTGTTATNNHGFYHNGQGYLLVALRQPLEFGHQTTHRYGIAKAAYTQLQWQIVQAELNTLVQTYRFFQTAAYRREKAKVAARLADFNENLRDTLDRRLGANQAQPADVALAKVEARATRQQARAAQQDYLAALTDLRNQIGVPDSAAETEPLGEFTLPGNIPPLDEQGMVDAALRCRADLKAAQANIDGAGAAVRLARGDRIPSAILGPQYVQDEAGIQYIGFNFVPTLPLANNGKPLVRQREADQRRAMLALQQAQQRVIAQVRSAVAKWNGATGLVSDSTGLTDELTRETDSLARLFEAGQTDLSRVTQARQRLIQLENAQLDAVWAATQAQADLMAALGIPSLIQNLLQTAEADAGVAPAPQPAPPMAPTPSPFAPAPR